MKKLTRILLLGAIAATTLGNGSCSSSVYMGVGVAGPRFGYPGPYPYPHPYPIGGGGVVVVRP